MLGTTYFIFEQDAELLGLLGRGDRVRAERHIDEDVGAAVGDVEQVGAEVRGAERRELFAHRLPADLLSELLHRVVDAVAISVVRHEVGGLAVFAELLGQHRRERLRRHIGRRLGAEAVALAILAGGVVGAAVADHVDDVLALSQFLHRDRYGAADAAGQHDGLVVANEAGRGLNGRIRFGFRVGDLEFDLLAEHALALFQGRNLLGHATAVVEVIDRQFEAELHVLSRGRIGSGERHHAADENAAAASPGRKRAERRMFFGEGRQRGPAQQEAGRG